MKFRLIISVVFVALLGAPQERSVVTAPAPVNLTVTEYQIAETHIARLPDWVLTIRYVDNLGKYDTDRHFGSEDHTIQGQLRADVLVMQLNKANLTTKSLERRALEHLIAEGKIPASTFTGTPQ